MKNRSKKSKESSDKSTAYITKRVLLRATRPAFKKASEKAMQTLGYVVKVEDNWVVRQYQDGRMERLTQLAPVTLNDWLLD